MGTLVYCGKDKVLGGNSLLPGSIPSARSKRASRPSSRARRLSSGMRETVTLGGGHGASSGVQREEGEHERERRESER
jgi:hypothetical protein